MKIPFNERCELSCTFNFLNCEKQQMKQEMKLSMLVKKLDDKLNRSPKRTKEKEENTYHDLQPHHLEKAKHTINCPHKDYFFFLSSPLYTSWLVALISEWQVEASAHLKNQSNVEQLCRLKKNIVNKATVFLSHNYFIEFILIIIFLIRMALIIQLF